MKDFMKEYKSTFISAINRQIDYLIELEKTNGSKKNTINACEALKNRIYTDTELTKDEYGFLILITGTIGNTMIIRADKLKEAGENLRELSQEILLKTQQ